MLKAIIRDQFDPILYRTSRLVQRIGLKPNTLTFIGLALNCLAAWDLAIGDWFQAANLIVLAGFFDILDGAVARNCKEASAFGSFFDSVMDRYSDLALFIGLLIFYAREGSVLYQVLVGISLMGSTLIPYSRARAEVLIPRCNVGIMERPERILLLFFGAAISSIMPIVIWVLAVATNITVIQRIIYTKRQLTNHPEGIQRKA
jgi:CDP-diacylglycerol---glycerol-3-phosphate 3-phosphatidyltransferase